MHKYHPASFGGLTLLLIKYTACSQHDELGGLIYMSAAGWLEPRKSGLILLVRLLAICLHCAVVGPFGWLSMWSSI